METRNNFIDNIWITYF